MAQRTAIGLTGDDLTVADVWAVAVDRAPAELMDAARAKMRAARGFTARANTVFPPPPAVRRSGQAQTSVAGTESRRSGNRPGHSRSYTEWASTPHRLSQTCTS